MTLAVVEFDPLNRYRRNQVFPGPVTLPRGRCELPVPESGIRHATYKPGNLVARVKGQFMGSTDAQSFWRW